MAKVNIVNAPAYPVRNSAVVSLETVLSETIDSAAVAKPSTIVASTFTTTGGIWVVTAVGGNIALREGSNPVAVVGDLLVLDGQTREFLARPGCKLSIIDVP